MQPSEKPSPTKSSAFAAPSISLPKGGGAIRGIGEKFSANVSNGTASLSVPLPLSPGRSGFGPQISLSYDSGAGNGPFGLGWSLVLPSITRKTDQGLPRYNDAEDSDVFIISGAEDLVPVLTEENGQWNRLRFERTVDGVLYRIDSFRPRSESLFARIERWTNLQDGITHWRSISPENVTTLYGADNNSRVFDPDDPSRIYRWLISENHDDRGNVIRYEYKAENSAAVALTDVHEKNRSDTSRSAERYLKRISYGNRVSRLIDPQAALDDWMFEAVFDYGEHDADNPSPSDDGEWLCRHDPFSSYRAGFELRSYRLCQRVLMFHHFPDDIAVGQNCLVRSTDFTYRNDLRRGHPIASFLASVTQCGYRRQDNGFLRRAMPPLELEYSASEIHEELRELEIESLENLPYGIDESHYQWLDLDGEGASGIVMKQAGSWFYKRNLSPLNARQNETAAAVLSPVETVTQQPSLNDASSQTFLDLAGDGQVDLVQFGRPVSGYFERTHQNDWSNFVPFASMPSISFDDANVKFVDLTGDGHADILISEEEIFVWYPSLGETGFAPASRVAQALDEEEGPRLVFSEPSQSIYLADLSGDGLTDLVRIRNGEVCYWPNLGYGKFGAKVTMDHAPWFEEPDQFDQKRIQLADIDGSGVTDIIYLGRDRVDLYFNQSGNSWSELHSLNHVPAINNLTSVAAIDLLGNGTACLTWSSTLPGEQTRSLRYIDLMGGQKPHLLVRTVNNLGAETIVQYASSTSFYLEDKFAGRPWLTKLPFPVHVVDRVVTLDHIARNRFTTRYAYHHGHFDGGEREFRGFGMVEQFDTEEFASLTAEGNLANIDEASHVPPVVTRSWFHTGALIDAGRISRQFEDEYYREGDASLGESELSEEQIRSMLLDDTVIPDSVRLSNGSNLPWTITPEETLEAARSLKGALLRQEIYALDSSEAADRPYSVSEQNYTIEMLQPRAGNQNAVFFTHARETVDFQYERSLYDVNGRMLADPRVAHSMVLATDIFGNVTESVVIAYGRRHPDQSPLLTEADHQRQQQLHITYTTNRFTNAVLEEDAYRTPAPAESRTFELINLELAAHQPDVTNLFRFEEMLGATQLVNDGAHDIPYENIFGEGIDAPARRAIEHTRAIYRSNDLSSALPLGQLESQAISFEDYRLAFSPSLITSVYGDRVTNEALAEGGYIDLDADGNWWTPSGRSFYSADPNDTAAQELAEAREHFFLQRRSVDPFDNQTTVTFDAHNLMPIETRDALGNTTQSQNDYRVLGCRQVTDPNGNRMQAEFDALAMMVGIASMGKESEQLGDSFAEFEVDLSDEAVIAHMQEPLANPHALLGTATARVVYDVHAYQRTSNSDNPEPIVMYTLKRETHVSDLELNQLPRIQHNFSYHDGLQREIQKKIQAEPGPVIEGEPEVEQRWVGSGWIINNNKGLPARQFEPFFSATHQFELAHATGVSPILCYDPPQRLVARINPNHAWEKVVFDPWQEQSWDVNDTVLENDPRNDPHVGDFFRRLADETYLPSWHTLRIGGQLGETQEQRQAEQNAAAQTAVHAGTPETSWFDSLGRKFLTVAHNRFEPQGETINEHYATRITFDIRGLHYFVRDARDRIVARNDYDLAGNQIHSASMDAGEGWILHDVLGQPIRKWNGSGRVFRYEFDELRRAANSFTSETGDLNDEILYQRIVYGEQEGDALNHCGRVFQVFDGAGTTLNTAYDFKGNLLSSIRQLLVNYREAVDWSTDPPLEAETFLTSTTYDALSRPVVLTAPDDSRINPTYNEAGLLERVAVNLQGANETTVFVDDIDYDAKGRRSRIAYGNGVTTTCEYDPETFLLTSLQTRRGNSELQHLSYTYDPAENITTIRDHAQQTVFFNNQVVDANARYTYDAVYRLIETSGREHIGQAAVPQTTWNDEFRVHLPHPNDGPAMRHYAERYEYDEVGNILRLVHQAINGNWNRLYEYNEPSQLQPAQVNNRLTQTQVGGVVENYSHDLDGNMTRMPHLPLMRSNFLNQLQATSQQVVNDDSTPETTYYVYDSTGQRVRKVTDRHAEFGQTPARRNERIYLNGFEIFREYEADGATLALERETLHVMDAKQRVALVETRTHGDDGSAVQLFRYQFSNHLGTAALELDESGNVITYEEFYPFGATSYQAGRTVVEVSRKRYRHTAKERDEETGLSYHGARYYASWLGRWTSADPAGLIDGPNLYQYVNSNPIGLVDLTGHNGEKPPKAKFIRSKKAQILGTAGKLNLTQPQDLTPPNSASTTETPSQPDDPPSESVPQSKESQTTSTGKDLKPQPPKAPPPKYVQPPSEGLVPNQVQQGSTGKYNTTNHWWGDRTREGKLMKPVSPSTPTSPGPTPPMDMSGPEGTGVQAQEPKSKLKFDRSRYGRGLAGRVLGIVLAIPTGIGIYQHSSDAKSAVKETVKITIESISPLPAPPENIRLEREEVEFRPVYFYAKPGPTEEDLRKAAEAEAEKQRKEVERLSQPGLIGPRRQQSSSSTTQPFDPRTQIDRDMVRRVLR